MTRCDIRSPELVPGHRNVTATPPHAPTDPLRKQGHARSKRAWGHLGGAKGPSRGCEKWSRVAKKCPRVFITHHPKTILKPRLSSLPLILRWHVVISDHQHLFRDPKTSSKRHHTLPPGSSQSWTTRAPNALGATWVMPKGHPGAPKSGHRLQRSVPVCA